VATPNANCSLCGAQSRIASMITLGGATYDLSMCDCPNCGRYVFDLILSEKLKEIGNDAPFRLACLLRERRLRKEKGVYGLFSTKIQPGENTVDKHLAAWWEVEELLSEFPQPTEIIDRALCNLSRLVNHPMETIERSQPELQFIMFCPERHLVNQLHYMQQMGLIHLSAEAYDSVLLTLSPQARNQIQLLATRRSDSK